MALRINHFDPQPDFSPRGVYLTEEQFEKLVELLTPGYHLAMAYLKERAEAQHPIMQVAPSDDPPFDP